MQLVIFFQGVNFDLFTEKLSLLCANGILSTTFQDVNFYLFTEKLTVTGCLCLLGSWTKSCTVRTQHTNMSFHSFINYCHKKSQSLWMGLFYYFISEFWVLLTLRCSDRESSLVQNGRLSAACCSTSHCVLVFSLCIPIGLVEITALPASSLDRFRYYLIRQNDNA